MEQLTLIIMFQAFVLNRGKNVYIGNLSFRDRSQTHLSLERSVRVLISNVSIRAPQQSPNTDGMHLQQSRGILCNPGQGISVGSLGKAGKHETVHAVIVRDVSLAGTMNGVWIKTWQGGRGYVRNILFNRINMIASDLPIIIDQNYSNHEIRFQAT
ncbi:hypothetical protein CDL15_Pgr025614 [Punica granatum]|uniref:Polygalacturonase-like n=1 Tax=Punica granatum TaxID=22663 RepID=A0A218WAF3_PUNGR|nr:hypothetical protein CDL15_Pgr025614 [Punica granatum]